MNNKKNEKADKQEIKQYAKSVRFEMMCPDCGSSKRTLKYLEEFGCDVEVCANCGYVHD
jgi:hypothetical protein